MAGKVRGAHKIVHFTTVHPRHDTRIRVKEVATLAAKFGSIVLLVQDGKGNAVENGGHVVIRDVGAPGGRFLRALRGSWRMWRAIRQIRPAIAHFHDPELIPLGVLIKISGVQVVYDVHEDVPRQLRNKQWLPKLARLPLSRLAELAEWIGAKWFDGVVTATPKIAERFAPHKTVIVQNFPVLSELSLSKTKPFGERPPCFAYIGSITAARGVRQMVEAIGMVKRNDAILRMAGIFQGENLREEVRSQPGWQKVDFIGWADRNGVSDLLGETRAGLVVLHPAVNYLDSYPVKMFEYMAAGLPVIASNFPLWRRIVESAQCGLLVDPLKPPAIARALDWILDHPEEAEEMGKRGREAIENKFNWNFEGKKLIILYKRKINK